MTYEDQDRLNAARDKIVAAVKPLGKERALELFQEIDDGLSRGETLESVKASVLKGLPRHTSTAEKEATWEGMHLYDAELRRLRTQIAAGEQELAELTAEFDSILPAFRERFEDVVKRSRGVTVAPDAGSATNVETIVQAIAYLLEPVTSSIPGEEKLPQTELAKLVATFAHAYPTVKRVMDRLALFPEEKIRGLNVFGSLWLSCGFPRLEVSHKLAATLAMTDVPEDIKVAAPWKAWSLIVPPGLFDGPEEQNPIARIWCIGSEIYAVILKHGTMRGPYTIEQIEEATELYSGIEATCRLVKGACLALSNPEDYKKKSATAPGKSTRTIGAPDFGQNRFLLSAPVTIDLRQELRESIHGRRGGGSPKVQFFVRGHWKNQPYGKWRLLRKTIRVDGFWKGPNRGDILLRNYQVKSE